MNEISRCCRVLGVKHGASFEELKKAYRDLVQVWHPDRFSSNERLQAKAQEHLKEINLAYEYLVARAFQDGFLLEPADAALVVSPVNETHAASDSPPSGPATSREKTFGWPEEEAEISPKIESRNAFWALCGVVAVLVGGGLLLYPRIRGRAQNPVPISAHNEAPAPSSQPDSRPSPVVEQAAKPTAKPVPAAQPGISFPYAKEVLASMISTNGNGWLQATQLLSPPFAIRAKVVLTDLEDLRLHYGLGGVIFNWADHPKEMRVHDPRTSNITPVPDRGILLPKEPHELVWKIAADEMSVSVDGEVRFQGKGDYEGFKAYPGIGPYHEKTVVESFILETPHPLEDPPVLTRDHGPVAGDILPSMIPEKNVWAANEPNGLAIWNDGAPGKGLMTLQTFRPPFIIRTRAKTDAFDVRLYCGEGVIIFNWRDNPQEMRVHDPLSGQQMPVPGKGLISPNEWHAFIWEIQNTGMRVLVDGQIRFQNRRDYHTLDASAGIGPAMGKITVDYFLVEQK